MMHLFPFLLSELISVDGDHKTSGSPLKFERNNILFSSLPIGFCNRIDVQRYISLECIEYVARACIEMKYFHCMRSD